MPVFADTLIAFILTWVVGLSPAMIIRYLWKKAPLTGWSATLVAASTSIFFALFFLIVRSELGDVDARISPAWVLVFFASRAIMLSGKRAELLRRLRDLIADPETAEDRRTLAMEKLQLLEKFESARSPRRSLSAPSGQSTLAETRQHAMPPDRKYLAEISRKLSLSGSFRAWLHRRRRTLALVLGGAFLFNVLLIVSGYRVLMHGTFVERGESYEAGDWKFGSNDEAVVVCRYWTGRSSKPMAWRYDFGENGVDECPFLYAPLSPQE